MKKTLFFIKNELMKEIFFSAGEVSGDISASELIKELSKKGIKCTGIGGKFMEEAGMINISGTDESTKSSVGFIESLKFILPKLSLLKKVSNYLKQNRPDLVVLVDNQGFNIPLAKISKQLGLRVYYYFPPMVSVWGEKTKYKIAKYCDKILCTFKDDYKIYKEVSQNAIYVGNPLVDRIKQNYSSKENYLKHFSSDTRKILLLPGSREQEIRSLLPVLLDTVRYVNNIDKNFEFYLIISHESYSNRIESEIKRKRLDKNVKIFLNQMDYALYDIADAVVASSGTITLELALLKKPTVVIYKISKLTFEIAKRLIKIPFISLPNIILKEKVFPELLQKDVNPKQIFKEIKNFLETDQSLLIEKLKKLEKLVEGGAASRVINEILSP
ncbi:MAG: lipid-A-disaccharide synthase [Brevinematia bacterium]